MKWWESLKMPIPPETENGCWYTFRFFAVHVDDVNKAGRINVNRHRPWSAGNAPADMPIT
jgi:hypothetical protein